MNKKEIVFENDDIIVEKFANGDYRVSFFENNHFKDDYYYKRESAIPNQEVRQAWTSSEDYQQWLEDLKKYVDTNKLYPDTSYTHSFLNISACETCCNNPKNGGSGICNCTIPYMTSTGSKDTTYGKVYYYSHNVPDKIYINGETDV